MCRNILIVILVGFCVLNINAQKPSWIKHLPQPISGNFYYRMTKAEGSSYMEAYKRTFEMAIYESYSKLIGIPVSFNEDSQISQESLYENMFEYEVQVRLPINKVCEYEEKVVTSNKIRLYVLWQVANSATLDPKFENFVDCE